MSTTDETSVLKGLGALKVTKYEKQFQKDTWDLFFSLALALRPRFQKQRPFKTFPNAFLGNEAISALSSLKFYRSANFNHPSQVVPASIVSLKMAADDAKGLMQNFMEARLIKDATTDEVRTRFKNGGIYQFTFKGLLIVAEFVELNAIESEGDHLVALLSTLPVPRPSLGQSLERRVSEDDSLVVIQSVATEIFNHFCGDTPNYGSGTKTGVRLLDPVARNRLLSEMFVGDAQPFDGKVSALKTTHCFEVAQMIAWLCSCTSINAHAEAVEMGAHFVRFGLITLVGDKAKSVPGNTVAVKGPVSCSNPLITAKGAFLYSWTATYAITDEGRRVAGWIAATDSNGVRHTDAAESPNQTYQRLTDNAPDPAEEKRKNAARLKIFLKEPHIRILLREFLQEKSCEYYLSFWLDVEDLRAQSEQAFSASPDSTVPYIPVASSSKMPVENMPAPPRVEAQHESLNEIPFLIYNTYLAPSSGCRLRSDIGDSLARELQTALEDILEYLTTKALFAGGEATSSSSALEVGQLQVLLEMYERIQSRVFRIMVGKYMPRFIKSPKFLAAHLNETVDDSEIIEEAREN